MPDVGQWLKDIEAKIAGMPKDQIKPFLDNEVGRTRAAKVEAEERWRECSLRLERANRCKRGVEGVLASFQDPKRLALLLPVREWVVEEMSFLFDRVGGERWPNTDPGGFRNASLVVWDPEIWSASQRGKDAFTDTMYKPPIDGFEGGIVQFWINAQWSDYVPEGAGTWLGVLSIIDAPHTVLTTDVWAAPGAWDEDDDPGMYGLTFNDWREIDFSQPVHEKCASVLAGLAFLGMEWVGAERQVLPRHLRRQAELGRRPPLPEVSVVRLRRPYRDDRPHATGESSREYSCQWMVGGHWRKQWYPSKAEWKQIYISPYLKGPEGKPFRNTQGTVYVANR